MNTLKDKTLKLLDKDIFNIERKYPAYEYFPVLIQEKLSEYLDAMNDVEFWQEFIDLHDPGGPAGSWKVFFSMITEFCQKINCSLNNYYLGRIANAYNDLSDGLDAILWKTSALFKESIQTVDIGLHL